MENEILLSQLSQTCRVVRFAVLDGDFKIQHYITDTGHMYSSRDGEHLKEVATSLTDASEYYRVTINHKTIFVHRAVAMSFVPVPEELKRQGYSIETLVVNHLDGNKHNNHYTNLEWTTTKGNTEHASKNGLMPLVHSDVTLRKVWVLLSEGYTNTEISQMLGIPTPSVASIRRGDSPRYLTDEFNFRKSSTDHKAVENRNKKIIELFKQGMDGHSISKQLHIVETTVCRIIRQYKVSHPEEKDWKLRHHNVMTLEKAKQICELLSKGYSNAQIVAITHADTDKISGIRARHHFTNISKDYTWDSDGSGTREELEQRRRLEKQICSEYLSGKRRNDIAKAHRVRFEYVNRVLTNNDIAIRNTERCNRK